MSYKSVTSVCQVRVSHTWVRWKMWQISIVSVPQTINNWFQGKGKKIQLSFNLPASLLLKNVQHQSPRIRRWINHQIATDPWEVQIHKVQSCLFPCFDLSDQMSTGFGNHLAKFALVPWSSQHSEQSAKTSQHRGSFLRHANCQTCLGGDLVKQVWPHQRPCPAAWHMQPNEEALHQSINAKIQKLMQK